MGREDLLERMREAVKAFDEEEARALAEEAVRIGLDPVEALEDGLARGLREVGDRFGRGEAFITELIAGPRRWRRGPRSSTWRSKGGGRRGRP